MKWQTIVSLLVAAPMLALFGGVGFLAWQVGQSWDTRNTDMLVSAASMSCAGGAVVVAMLLALIVGVPLALRAYQQAGHARQAWPEPQYRALPPASSVPHWQQQPPMIADKQAGSWHTSGPGQYDLWDVDQQPAEIEEW